MKPRGNHAVHPFVRVGSVGFRRFRIGYTCPVGMYRSPSETPVALGFTVIPIPYSRVGPISIIKGRQLTYRYVFIAHYF